MLFHEYFHGDTGHGLGAAHQTGWTGVIADVIRRRHGAVRSAAEVIDTLYPALGPTPSASPASPATPSGPAAPASPTEQKG